MLILILGVALFWVVHLFKHLLPEQYAALGKKALILTIGLSVVSLILMIWGYKVADGPYWWGRNPALVGINNLLILIAFYLFAAAGMKTAITKRLRHPQMIATILWAMAHLLVNGDLPSFVLFGGLLLWAVAQIALVNRNTTWSPPAGPFPIRKEIMAVAGAIIVMAVVGIIHGWVGPPPFGG